MIVGFQILPQNSNRITFDPPLGKTKLENWLTILSISDGLNFAADSRSLLQSPADMPEH